ncbi:MAG: hypothetical protein A2096_00720 [Spirochaetes bacterium GWF1_41_5]|nr:MAG: hypothetical protein A2096_00720 [Spirochaetes bacterium GWF1_41_5]
MKNLLKLIALLVMGITILESQTPFKKKMTIIETIPLYTFEQDGEWKFETSKFGVQEQTKIKMYNFAPKGLTGSANVSEKCLGLHTAFTRKGNNYVDLIPVQEPIPIAGQVQSLDVWVWGGNFNYKLEMHFEDYTARVWIFDLGNLKYYGWENKSTTVDASIPQAEPYAPSVKGLTFRKFRIWSSPSERVDRFHVFFDYFKAVSDVYRQQYDGYELEKAIAEEELGSKQSIYGGTKTVKPAAGTAPAN